MSTVIQKCSTYPVLHVLEYAWRCTFDSTKWLKKEELDENKIHIHLYGSWTTTVHSELYKVEFCSVCKKWFENACRVFTDLAIENYLQLEGHNGDNNRGENSSGAT